MTYQTSDRSVLDIITTILSIKPRTSTSVWSPLIILADCLVVTTNPNFGLGRSFFHVGYAYGKKLNVDLECVTYISTNVYLMT